VPAPRFKTRIWINGRTVFLGSFANEEQAARAFDMVALHLHGAQGACNFPSSHYDVAGLMATPLAELVAQLRGQASRTRLELPVLDADVPTGAHSPSGMAAASGHHGGAHLPEMLGLTDVPATPRASSRRITPSVRSLRAAGVDDDAGGAWKTTPAKKHRSHHAAPVVSVDAEHGAGAHAATEEVPLSPQDAAVTLLALLQNHDG
jgi:hypothetical protein